MRSIREFLLVLLLVTLVCPAETASVSAADSLWSGMPPNETRLIQALLSRQGLTLGGNGANSVTPAEAQSMVRKYIQQKLGSKPEDHPNPLAAERLRHAERTGIPMGLRHGKKLGRSQVIPNSEPVPYEDEIALDRILIILVEFTDPEHNNLPQPAADNNIDYWVPDFDSAHYQNMLFDLTPGAQSMSNYYLSQSLGAYTVNGTAFGWVKLNVSESEYGADSATGNDNANGPVWRVVQDAVAAFGDAVPWAEYDQEDPYDLDGDGNYAEPDGYVDHLMVVHAGAGQEGGGGAQGDNAIWSHSWWVDFGDAGPGYGGTPTSDPNVWVGPYTIMPEDGTIGVFCHEFAHDLGLPDEYDTIYSGEASTGFWTLMAGGSWLGQPLGTCPANISIWGRMALGWVTPTVVSFGEPAQITLDRAEMRGANAPAVRINLPPKSVLVEINTPYSGGFEWYSGSGDMIDQLLYREIDLTGTTNAVLTFMTWFEIEQDWDYGYVEVSIDGGAGWIQLPGNLTTTADPNGNNDGNGITGESGGWVQGVFDLSAFSGRQILLRFRYTTDEAVAMKGWALDDVAVNAIGFLDDVEAGAGDWIADGWQVFAGRETREFNHYYLLELRDFYAFDQSLANCYSFYGDPDTVEFFPYTPGVLLWYRDMQYEDNWVGEHPGHGFLLVVDSHAKADRIPRGGGPWRTRIQVRDATFGLDRTLEAELSQLGLTKTYHSKPPVPLFDDRKSYWDHNKPDSSVIVPTYGVCFRVAGEALDGSAVLIMVYF